MHVSEFPAGFMTNLPVDASRSDHFPLVPILTGWTAPTWLCKALVEPEYRRVGRHEKAAADYMLSPAPVLVSRSLRVLGP